MLFVFDVPTTLAMTATASLTMAAALLVVRSERREGLGLWAAALLLHTLAYGLLLLRGAVSDWVSVWLANVMLSASFALTLAAVCQFRERPTPWGFMLLPMVLTALGFVWAKDSYAMRLQLSGGIFSLQFALALWFLWRPQSLQIGAGIWLMSCGLVLQISLLLGRAVLVWRLGVPGGGLMQPGGTQSLIFMVGFAVIILASLGFILMTKERADAQNHYFATHDGLTGLFNRRALITSLERDLARAARNREDYSLILLDVDHFKYVNDHHGHLVGDQVLRHISQVLTAKLRAQDLVGRYGGEEFLLLLPSTPLGGALQLAQTLREHMEATACTVEGQVLTVTISLGVVSCQPRPGDSWQPLLHAADEALYRAKSQGRNQVQCAPAWA